MKKGIFLISLSVLMILGLSYGLWKLDQPRVGPVGSGTYPITTYIPFYAGIISGILGLIMGIMSIVKRKEWSKYHDTKLSK